MSSSRRSPAGTTVTEPLTEQDFQDRRERWYRVVDEWQREDGEPVVHVALPAMPLGEVMCGADLSYRVKAADWWEPVFGEGPICESCLRVVTPTG